MLLGLPLISVLPELKYTSAYKPIVPTITQFVLSLEFFPPTLKSIWHLNLKFWELWKRLISRTAPQSSSCLASWKWSARGVFADALRCLTSLERLCWHCPLPSQCCPTLFIFVFRHKWHASPLTLVPFKNMLLLF